MKIKTNGTLYDTETAVKLGEGALQGQGYGSWVAGLYKTPRSHKYFLAGEGGALSIYGVPSIRGRVHGKRIVPITQEQAVGWAETHLNTKLVKKYFFVGG